MQEATCPFRPYLKAARWGSTADQGRRLNLDEMIRVEKTANRRQRCAALLKSDEVVTREARHG